MKYYIIFIFLIPTSFSFAYPFGKYNMDVRSIVSSNYQAARSVNLGLCYDNTNFFQLPTFFFSSKTKLKTANDWLNSAIHNNKWLIESFHGFDGAGYQAISSDLFKSHMAYIKSKENVIWVATLKDVVKYFRERQNAIIEIIDTTKYFIRIKIRDNLPDSIYNHPLTKVRIPKSRTNISLENQGTNIEYHLDLDPLGNKFLVFDAIPDKGTITIKSETPFDLPQESCLNCKVVIYPNPFNNFLDILWNPDESGNYSLINPHGHIITNGDLKEGYKRINTDILNKGVYFLLLNFNGLVKNINL